MTTKNSPFPKYKIFLSWIVQGCAFIIAKIVFTIFVNVRVTGIENVKSINYGPVIYASNHSNDLDSVFIRTSLPLFNKTTTLFAVCRKLKDYGWHGWRTVVYKDWFFRMMGAYPAEKGTHDYSKSLETILKICESGQTVLIFIGGMQKTIDEPIKNRGGTSYLSWASGVPVVPVAVNGTHDLTFKKLFLSKPQITICFGKPITREELFSNQDFDNPDFSEASIKIVNEIEKMRGEI